ncbi:BZ3500_MvSof-1268-A1-R1_Chr10-2g03004 [Microbotryum saponariae]|uniref:BZ3500_MvSof-1268-A1-R1_Chr10-2g03004 protein n=1 Tax=Microbotryum saponariae TaxID=289078 RepID=A0A2X0LRP7_9BASI|nr:BZ3501_MvSof-1269-A2-R1_Chr10-2g02590 [Microbotryum saponariae]SDA01913.1 BZ3500_MvSof-1268-A1-R1_Chr10-2g03004 [Microbotryum saponariae]
MMRLKHFFRPYAKAVVALPRLCKFHKAAQDAVEKLVREERLLDSRLIRLSWSDDPVNCRTLFFDRLEKEHHNSRYARAIKNLEELETVGPLLPLCSASYKALVWLGDILENLDGRRTIG